jgi:hypothetical protein
VGFRLWGPGRVRLALAPRAPNAQARTRPPEPNASTGCTPAVEREPAEFALKLMLSSAEVGSPGSRGLEREISSRTGGESTRFTPDCAVTPFRG